jgi:hypothetical protein
VDLPKTSETLEFSSELDEGSSVKKSLKGEGSGTTDSDSDSRLYIMMDNY